MPGAVASRTSPGAGDSADRVTARPMVGLLAFRRLDSLLANAVTAARERYGADAGADAYRGLYLGADAVQDSLHLPAGTPLATDHADPARPDWDAITADNPRWHWLRWLHGLCEFELDVVLVALGPELDRRYERLYGFLQDDVSCRRPTVDLALSLLTSRPLDRVEALNSFAGDAPLLAGRVLSLRPDHRTADPPLIARTIVLDEQVVAALLGLTGLDRRIAAYCRISPPSVGDGAAGSHPLLELVRLAWRTHPLRLCLHGPSGSGKGLAAEQISAGLGVELLVVELARLPVDADTLPEFLRVVFATAGLRGALLYLRGVDALLSADRLSADRWSGQHALAEELAGYGGVVLMSCAHGWTPFGPRRLGVLNVPFAAASAADRQDIWERALTAQGARPPAADLVALAGRFRLTPAQIEDSALTAVAAARHRSLAGRRPADDVEPVPTPTRDELFAAARGQTGRALTGLARKVTPVHGWEDIVLVPDAADQLRQLCDRVAHRRLVMEDWGFDRLVAYGKGVSALFSGPPGTGKTMAAQVIAHELGLDLFTIDLSSVVSKYIGETEKNLETVFTAATDADGILFFDEADALFGKRSEVRDSHDRYANLEIAYLLQRMEQFEGLSILATNVRHHLDEAFTRRLQFVIEFPLPDVAERIRIWRCCLPEHAPLDHSVDLDRLAREFRLTGGDIKNIVLAAAFLAAGEGQPIAMGHVLQATRQEHQKLGKVLPVGLLDVDPGRE